MKKTGYTLSRKYIDHVAKTETYIYRNGAGGRFELTIRDGRYLESARKFKKAG
jgi:hypothetical protein